MSINSECDIIRDLIPLYRDGIASTSSRDRVHKHLKSCPECRKYYKAYAKSPANAAPGELIVTVKNSGGFAELSKRIRRRRRYMLAGGFLFLLGVLFAYIRMLDKYNKR